MATLSELNNHLFAQLDRLDAENLSADQIAAEVARAEAAATIADRITETAKVQLAAAKLFAEHRDAVMPYLPQIGKAAPQK